MSRKRSGYALFQLLVIIAVLLLLAGMLLPAVQKARGAAVRAQSQNNLKQIAIAMHNYHDTNKKLPPGVDDRHFSALAHILPYIEQDNLYRKLDFTRDSTHEDNAAVRATLIPVFKSNLDPIPQPDKKAGPTNYFLVAGSKNALEDNDGVFYSGSSVMLTGIADGTSNTLMAIESLVGDGGTKAENVKRQHVRLKKADLKKLADEAGVKDFKDGTNVVGTRGASWMDGRFLQSTIVSTRTFDDAKPDVDCGGAGGHAGPRSLLAGTNVGTCDGAVRFVNDRVTLDVWKALATRGGGEVIGDF